MFDRLPRVRVEQMSELRLMIERRQLYTLGLGLTDALLIASAFLELPALLWI
jgi:hypothetical protein